MAAVDVGEAFGWNRGYGRAFSSQTQGKRALSEFFHGGGLVPGTGTHFRRPVQRLATVIFFAAILAICGIGHLAAREDVGADEAVDAIWHVHALDLEFRSPSTYYYCDTLQNKIAIILRMVGAGDPMRITTGCSGGAPMNHASVRVIVGVPVEATPENIRIETTYDAHMELVARLRNWRLPTPTTIRRFRATWTTVSFSHRGRLHLAPEDCDLLHDMSEQIFPQLAIRVSKGRLSCTSLGSPRLEVKALLPLST